jgi:hypothetical protein
VRTSLARRSILGRRLIARSSVGAVRIAALSLPVTAKLALAGAFGTARRGSGLTSVMRRGGGVDVVVIRE